MPITIPERLHAKLHSDTAYEGHIHTLIRNTRALITEKADFFPEYTIHGWSHIQAVLHHADKLIPDVTLEALSGRDAALLIAAVVLHDLGMFLGESGVRSLLTGPRASRRDARLDKQDWKTAWRAYLHEIRRYPEEKLLYHFGMSGAIGEPDLEKGEFSDLDRLIVGDFLRRHHHRIAHEIALGAMPGDTDIDVLRVGTDALGNQAFDSKDRKCIGILARSHGMPIRHTLEYIRREIGSRHLEKLVCLMAVLRIADALDADEQRAPDTVRKLQGIRTPVSVQEWTWNQRITRTDLDWDADADFKYVEAEPGSTTEFVHLERWLEGVQRELDTCWAVLSELCDTQRYRLSIHRIESNILEEERRESYGEKFITKEARLNANPELLKLLVAPLYDDDPSCGVRELLQNAVDACNERAYLEGAGYRGQVEIRLDTKAKTMTVTDNGIGMDENVLLNYYLSAGASYRTSDQWFEQFATDRDPNIVRTGRFGVGVLATFLLGHHIRVTTRHMDDELGYTFEFGLEPKALDIKRPEEQPEIGTTITVTLKEDALEKLRDDYKDKKKWLNWYRFAEPSVRYWVDGEEYVSEKPFIPQDGREMPGWFDLPGTEFEMVRWGYPEDGFFCNGIRIPEGIDFLENADKDEQYYHRFCLPSVSVKDKKGHMPVDLSRRKLSYFSSWQQLLLEAKRYAQAQLLVADWSSEMAVCNRISNGIWKFRDSGDHFYIPCISTSSSFSLLSMVPQFADRDFSVLEIFCTKEIEQHELLSIVRQIETPLPIVICPFRIRDIDENTNHLPFGEYSLSMASGIGINCFINRIWADKKLTQCTFENSEYLSIRFLTREITEDCVECIPVTQENDHSIMPFRIEKWDSAICPAITELTVKAHSFEKSEEKQDTFFTDFIKTYMDGDPWIPYKMEDRRKKFPKAFGELKYYIDRILADREKK